MFNIVDVMRSLRMPGRLKEKKSPQNQEQLPPTNLYICPLKNSLVAPKLWLVVTCLQSTAIGRANIIQG